MIALANRVSFFCVAVYLDICNLDYVRSPDVYQIENQVHLHGSVADVVHPRPPYGGPYWTK
jgi:hypothetical protein